MHRAGPGRGARSAGLTGMRLRAVRRPRAQRPDEPDDRPDEQAGPEQRPEDDPDDRRGPEEVVPAVREPEEGRAVVRGGQAGQEDDDRPGQAGAHVARQGLLEVDTPVGLLRQERPGQAVENQAEAGEDRQDEPDAAHKRDVHAEAPRRPARDSAEPPLIGAHQAGAPGGVEEAGGRPAPWRRVGPLAGARGVAAGRSPARARSAPGRAAGCRVRCGPGSRAAGAGRGGSRGSRLGRIVCGRCRSGVVMRVVMRVVRGDVGVAHGSMVAVGPAP